MSPLGPKLQKATRKWFGATKDIGCVVGSAVFFFFLRFVIVIDLQTLLHSTTFKEDELMR